MIIETVETGENLKAVDEVPFDEAVSATYPRAQTDAPS
jgi:hypothetical protein